MNNSGWKSVWSRRPIVAPDPSDAHVQLSRLLDADGFNTGFGSITVADWTAFVGGAQSRLRVSAGDSLLEVGCGAGAFLYIPYTEGIHVAGVDYSESLVEAARAAMPEGTFVAAEARDIDDSRRYTATVSCSVFQYFPGEWYAQEVIGKMVRMATRSVAILDIPDLATADRCLAVRQAGLGGAAAYERRYEGLDHLAYKRDWIVRQLRLAGAKEAWAEQQDIQGYENSRFRFNAYARI